jgi:hypothetical protein
VSSLSQYVADLLAIRLFVNESALVVGGYPR